MGNSCAPTPSNRNPDLSPPPTPVSSAKTQQQTSTASPENLSATSNSKSQESSEMQAPNPPSSLSQVFQAMPPAPPGTESPKISSPSVDSYDSRHVSLSDSSLPQNVRQVLAANKIRRLAQRKKALQVAQAENQWKIFADLDTKDEAEMLHLAVFMQTLIDTVPGAAAGRSEKSKLREVLSVDENDPDVHKDELSTMTIKLGDVKYKEVHARHHSLSTNNMKEYDLCDIDLDAECVQEVLNIYRLGGRLSRNSVVKILRKTYRLVLKIGNLTRVNIPDRGMCTVVGDLHGQLTDLLCIMDTAGLPSVDNRFIFNGDFVDRGEKGLEIVCILFLMFVVFGPEVVCLNRGNHEDLPVCRVYGFEQEVKEKYDELLFEMFAEVFNHLPLFAVINDSIFVVHGGLFHNPQATIQDLEDIDRTDYFVKPPVPYPQNIIGLSPEDQRKEYLKQLQRDAMWSDPTDEYGCFLNPRGAGVSFGPDIASQFMMENGFSMVVRSHECVMRGFELPYQLNNSYSYKSHPMSEDRHGFMLPVDIYDEHSGVPFVCTLFSASNYIGGDNDGAILQFASHPFHMSAPVGSKSPMHYYVRRYKTSEADRDLVASNTLSLRELILKKKYALSTAFEAADLHNDGVISRIEWADIMQRVTMMKIRWLGVINTLAPADCLNPTSVYYRKFLANFSLGGSSAALQAMESKGVDAKSVLDDMYGMRKQLETVFYFFDTNGDGVISREEFREGCAKLNSSLHPDCQLTNIDRTLEVMDFDGSGTIDINEFFETFRILDAKDGKVDGVISLAQQNKPKLSGVDKLLS